MFCFCVVQRRLREQEESTRTNGGNDVADADSDASDWENEADKLYEWTKELSPENINYLLWCVNQIAT